MLSTDLNDPSAVPYFLWDQPMTIAEVRQVLSSGSDESFRLLGKIMREARDRDVWRFATPKQVKADWAKVSPFLGRRRPFWEFLLGAWEREGLIG